MAGDWVKLHRQTLDSQVFSDPAMWHLFCWCMLKTNWKTGWFQGVEIPSGSFATGREAAGESLGMSGQSWYRKIKKLEAMGVIDVKANNRFTVISVLKWSFFQNGEQPSNNERTTSEHTNEQRVNIRTNTIEEGKKLRREERKNTHTHPASEGFEKEWQSWMNFREAIDGRPLDPIRADAELMELGRRPTDKAARDITFSIRKGAKSILDSDNDFEQTRSRTKSTGGTKFRSELTL